MAKQKGFFSLVTGIVLGAAASYLSNEKNREKTKKVILSTATKVKKAEAEYKKNPTAFKKKAIAQAKKKITASTKKPSKKS